MQAKHDAFHPDEMYYKMETLGFDENDDEHMEADVPFAQMQNEYSFGVQLQAQNSIGY